ncbi:MAG: hypothetical protein DHS20C21_17140 [Gemmatimonadota bacterium]|nr:MAG: hypothetical protein DHS20C21_17140 [Gemmatimonadota bacterium]
MTEKGTTSPAELSFEDSLERLEEIVGRLETGDAPLEQGLALFEEGVALTRRCHELLSSVEQRVQRLVKEEDGSLSLDLFPTTGEEDAE